MGEMLVEFLDGDDVEQVRRRLRERFERAGVEASGFEVVRRDGMPCVRVVSSEPLEVMHAATLGPEQVKQARARIKKMN